MVSVVTSRLRMWSPVMCRRLFLQSSIGVIYRLVVDEGRSAAPL